MSTPAYNSVAWFQIGTDDVDGAKRFYGSLFDWTFSDDAGYELVTAPGAGQPAGGVTDTKGEFPNHAIFMVVVENVAASCARAEELGGKILVPPTTTPDGLVFAHLHDPAGNHVGVFTPAP
jgi:predicted enzyme related to lactoylglutathione lyase